MQGHVARKRDRYYAVIYEGPDPVTARERRRWHPAGTDRRRQWSVATAGPCQRLGPALRAWRRLLFIRPEPRPECFAERLCGRVIKLPGHDGHSEVFDGRTSRHGHRPQ